MADSRLASRQSGELAKWQGPKAQRTAPVASGPSATPRHICRHFARGISGVLGATAADSPCSDSERPRGSARTFSPPASAFEAFRRHPAALCPFPRWQHATIVGHQPPDHCLFQIRRHFAYVDDAAEHWDAMSGHADETDGFSRVPPRPEFYQIGAQRLCRHWTYWNNHVKQATLQAARKCRLLLQPVLSEESCETGTTPQAAPPLPQGFVNGTPRIARRMRDRSAVNAGPSSCRLVTSLRPSEDLLLLQWRRTQAVPHSASPRQKLSQRRTASQAAIAGS